MLNVVVAVIVAWSSCFLGGAESPIRVSQSIIAYDQGDYDTAIDIISKLIEQGHSHGSLFYNLGNAYFRKGEKGQAVAAYLAARNLMPRDPDIRANLKFVLAQGKDNLAANRPSFFRMMFFWLEWSTSEEVFYFAGILGCVGFFFLFLWLLLKRPALKNWSAGVLLGACLSFLAFSISLIFQEQWGAVVKGTSSVYSGPGGNNTIVFELHEGAPFVIDLKENGWVRIELSDGKRGWLETKDAAYFE